MGFMCSATFSLSSVFVVVVVVVAVVVTVVVVVGVVVVVVCVVTVVLVVIFPFVPLFLVSTLLMWGFTAGTGSFVNDAAGEGSGIIRYRTIPGS